MCGECLGCTSDSVSKNTNSSPNDEPKYEKSNKCLLFASIVDISNLIDFTVSRVWLKFYGSIKLKNEK